MQFYTKRHEICAPVPSTHDTPLYHVVTGYIHCSVYIIYFYKCVAYVMIYSEFVYPIPGRRYIWTTIGAHVYRCSRWFIGPLTLSTQTHTRVCMYTYMYDRIIICRENHRLCPLPPSFLPEQFTIILYCIKYEWRTCTIKSNKLYYIIIIIYTRII